MEKQHLYTQTHTPSAPRLVGVGPNPAHPSHHPPGLFLFLLPIEESLEQIPRKPETKPLILLLSLPHLTNSR